MSCAPCFCRALTAFRLPKMDKNMVRGRGVESLIIRDLRAMFLQSIDSLSAAQNEQKHGARPRGRTVDNTGLARHVSAEPRSSGRRTLFIVCRKRGAAAPKLAAAPPT